ncbi:MAG: hypothetical protein ACK551_00030 [Vampirovibrionales bacterium]
MASGFLPKNVPAFSAPQNGVAIASSKQPLYWSTTPFNYPTLSKVIQAKTADESQNSQTSEELNPQNPTTFTPEEAKRLNVLVQTDALLDNPKFEPAHASLIGLKEGAKIGALIGLPLATLMMSLRAFQAQQQNKKINSFLTRISKHYFAVFGFESFEHLTHDGKKWEDVALKRTAKVIYGTGLSALIGGLFFGPAVAFLIVSNARSKLQNIKRSIKNDYKDYKPDFIDKHFSHIDKVEDPQSEYNKVRQELTNKRDAAANGFHTAVFVKVLTLGSKLAAAGVLGGLFEVGRHSWGYWDKVKDRPKNEGVDYKTEEGSKKLELNNYARVKKDLLYGWHTQGHEPNVELGLFYKQNELSGQEMAELEKSANTLIDALEETSVKNWMSYISVRLKHSPITHLLKETGTHLINPLMLGNFLITPAVVALSMIPFFVNEVGVEPFHPNNPEGRRWEKLMKGVRLSPRKTEVKPSPTKG